ncbi:hypothetical protein OEZ86_011331 [Tetradesmus obliquus]|nr:hypothetical protein OEZ86_011331 [Tetradesmus obliquus]
MGLIARLLGGGCWSGASVQTKQHGEQRHPSLTAAASGKAVTRETSRTGKDFAAEVLHKSAGGAAACAGAGAAADSASCSSGIPAAYNTCSSRHATDGFRRSTDAASTSYPTTCYGDDWDALGACMTTAMEMEACVDAVLEGSIKSAQHLFGRYDMDLDGSLCQQDFYDLLLELNLALPYPDYQRFVDACFAAADADRDGRLSIHDFIPLYKAIAAVRRAFRRQDHHSNGQIDRYDFYQMLHELELDGGEQGLQAVADAAFSKADAPGRGIVNFGQVLVWYSIYMLGSSLAHGSVQQQ